MVDDFVAQCLSSSLLLLLYFVSVIPEAEYIGDQIIIFVSGHFPSFYTFHSLIFSFIHSHSYIRISSSHVRLDFSMFFFSIHSKRASLRFSCAIRTKELYLIRARCCLYFFLSSIDISALHRLCVLYAWLCKNKIGLVAYIFHGSDSHAYSIFSCRKKNNIVLSFVIDLVL